MTVTLAAAWLAALVVVVAQVDASCDLATVKEGGSCSDAWSSLKPHVHTTQQAVGYAWVLSKAAKFDSAKHAQEQMADEVQKAPHSCAPQLTPRSLCPLIGMNVLHATQPRLFRQPIPVVKGPQNDVWIIDHHHTLAALDYSQYSDTVITLQVVCDYSNITTVTGFWDLMLQKRAVCESHSV